MSGRGKRFYLVLDGEKVYSGRVLSKTLKAWARFWPGAVLESEDGTLIALVTLGGSRAEGWRWVVKCCPHCGETHVHGGGPGNGDPRRRLTHRISHCSEGERFFMGYDLVEEES